MKQKALKTLSGLFGDEFGISCNDLLASLPDGTGYIPLSVKEKWFRLVYPKGSVRTEIIKFDDIMAVVKASIYEDKNDENPISTGFACSLVNNPDHPELGGCNTLQTAETMAKSRAYSAAGFGPIAAEVPEGLPEAPIQMDAADTPIPEEPPKVTRKKREKKSDTPAEDNTDEKVSTETETSTLTENTEEQNNETPVEFNLPSFCSKTPEEYEVEVQEIQKTLDGRKAGGIVITYGSLRSKTLKEVASAETSEDKVEKLRPYCDITSTEPNDLRVVAAARLYVASFDRKHAKAAANA